MKALNFFCTVIFILSSTNTLAKEGKERIPHYKPAGLIGDSLPLHKEIEARIRGILNTNGYRILDKADKHLVKYTEVHAEKDKSFLFSVVSLTDASTNGLKVSSAACRMPLPLTSTVATIRLCRYFMFGSSLGGFQTKA